MKTHAIITFSKGTHQITKKEFELIKTSAADSWIELEDESLVRISTIAEVIDIAEFFKRYPKEREPEEMVELGFSEEDISHLEQFFKVNQPASGILFGLRQFCVDNPQAKNARAMFDKRMADYQNRFNTYPQWLGKTIETLV